MIVVFAYVTEAACIQCSCKQDAKSVGGEK